MISNDSGTDSITTFQTCAECGALHGKNEARRIIISYCGVSHQVMMAQGLVRRLCLAYGLKLQVSNSTKLLWNTPSIQSSLVISAPADFIWHSTSPGSLASMMQNRAAALGALYDLALSNYGPNKFTSSLDSNRNTYAEWCGNFGNGGMHYEAGRNKGRVWGLWHAHLVPFPHFCQWKRLPVYLRTWSGTWMQNIEQLPLSLCIGERRATA